jgi:tRNA-binding EMAP/Myf-like protein
MFNKLSIRACTIMECNPHPESEKLYVSKVWDGENDRMIGSGVKKFIPIEEMKGMCIIVSNLKPKKMIDF